MVRRVNLSSECEPQFGVCTARCHCYCRGGIFVYDFCLPRSFKMIISWLLVVQSPQFFDHSQENCLYFGPESKLRSGEWASVRRVDLGPKSGPQSGVRTSFRSVDFRPECGLESGVRTSVRTSVRSMDFSSECGPRSGKCTSVWSVDISPECGPQSEE